jgi:hypothetical protein
MQMPQRSWRRLPVAVAILAAVVVPRVAAAQSNRVDGIVLRAPSLVDVPLDGAVPRGGSILLSYANGASPYSGIGRYEGRATCTAFFIATALPSEDDLFDAPAYAVTAGHCVARLDANQVVINGPGGGQVVFNYFVDGDRWRVAVPVVRVAYAAVTGRDVAVLELAITYRNLVHQLIRPWRIARVVEAPVGDQVAIVGAPLWRQMDQQFLRVSTCVTEGIAPIVIEHATVVRNALYNRCRDILPGSAGSPVVSVVGKMVIGIVGTTTIGAAPMTTCGEGAPCEPSADGPRTRHETTYVTPIAGIYQCFDAQRQFAVGGPECPLDSGTQVHVSPPSLGPVNPRLKPNAIGAARPTWHVTVSGSHEFYRYAVVQPPMTDCLAPTAYGQMVSIATQPVIDAPLPDVQGIALLCVVGVDGPGGRPAEISNPAVVMARIDTKAPHTQAQVRIEDDEGEWQIYFKTMGEEVAFYAFKSGPAASTRCGDPASYELVGARVVALPRATGPYVVCVSPYDAAQNAGRVFERKLP